MTHDPRAKDSPTREEPSSPDRHADDPRLEVSPGLLTPAHRRKLGAAFPFYLWLLHRRRPQTSPWVGGTDPRTKKPVLWKIDFLAAMHEVSRRTMRDWIAACVAGGYVLAEVVNTGRAADSGIRIRVLKSKFWRAGKLCVVPDPTPGRSLPHPPGNILPGVPSHKVAAQWVAGSLPQEAKTLPKKKKDSTSAVSEGTARHEAGARAPKDKGQRP